MGPIDLPDVFLRIAPELGDVPWPREVLADCARCAMQAGRGSVVAFTARARCCTYQPRLPNFLAGRALRRGDVGSERVAARLADLRGIDARGIRGVPELAARYARRADEDFGRNDALTCPYWVDGPLGCSIHRDRNAICRTWFCKQTHGARGAMAWANLKATLRSLEHTLVELCVDDGAPPGEGTDAAGWAAWFTWCADHVDGLDDTRIAALRGERLHHLLSSLGERVAERDAPLPDVVIPHVQSWSPRGDRMAMTAWSPYDLVDLPGWIFTFLAQLDGERTWREARELAEAELDGPISDDLVLVLWRRGLISPPIDLEGLPVNPELELEPG